MKVKQLILPATDNDGNYYISHSQITKWKRSKREYIRQKMFGEPFVDNAYTLQGKEVGTALELNDFSGYTKEEQKFLSTIPRLGEYEREVKLQMSGYYVLGYIDSNTPNLTHILDYKQGIIEKKKEEYESDDYIQLDIYAAAIEQETGVLPTRADVILMGRSGNAFKGEKLEMTREFITINRPVTPERIAQVKVEIQAIAEDIARHYEAFLKFNN